MNPLVHKRPFKPGIDWVYYAPHTTTVFDEAEISAVVASLRGGWLGTGPITQKFEDAVARLFGKKYGLFVNSGSSANLLSMLACHFKKGSEVITPSCTFNTTVAPIIQAGLKPVLIDVLPGQYVVDPKELTKALSKKTVAMLIPHLIGNFADLSALRAFCKKHKLILVEDSCDTIGGTYHNKPSGAFADITTTSFYASHIITAGGSGGMIMSDDKELIHRARVIASWGRGIKGYTDSIEDRLSAYRVDGEPYDSAFVFVEKGYNFKPTEMQAAFGLQQLKRLKQFTAHRQRAFKKLLTFFSAYEDLFILPKEQPYSKTHWLAFPLTIKPGASFTRNELVTYLEHHKVQTRPIFSGNIVKHEAYPKGSYRAVGSLKHSQQILHNGLLIGAHHGLSDPMLRHMCDTLRNFLKTY